jgi:hypothetical protein
MRTCNGCKAVETEENRFVGHYLLCAGCHREYKRNKQRARRAKLKAEVLEIRKRRKASA